MTTQGDSLGRYNERLMFALRMREVPGERIGEVLAEVEAHVAESGEDPASSFGRPQDYAAEVAAAAGASRSPWRLAPVTVAICLVIAAGAWAAVYLLTGAAFGWGSGRGGGSGTLGLSVGTAAGLGTAAAIAVALGLTRYTRHHQDLVVDPRTGARAAAQSGWVVALSIVATLAVVVALAFVGGLLAA